jgi:hypothetical protein
VSIKPRPSDQACHDRAVPTLPLTPDELLTTTRSVRKRLDFDRPEPLELVRGA